MVKIHQGSLGLVSSAIHVTDGYCDQPAEGFIRPGVFKEVVDVVKIGEVGVYLHHPIWLRKDDGPDEHPAGIFGKERFDLHPRDNVM